MIKYLFLQPNNMNDYDMKEEKGAVDEKKALTLKTLTKSSVWDVQENDIFRMFEAAEKEADLKENFRHYLDIIRSAFEMEEVKIDKPEVIKKYEARGFKIANIKLDENTHMKLAIKKRPIMRVTDLTYENIRHISAAKLMEVIDRNFGGGWDSLNQGVKDIILSAFDISTTTTPKERLHKPGGLYEIKVEDGYEVLEIEKGSWTEAIFAKVKPKAIKLKMSFDAESKNKDGYDGDDSDEDVEVRDDYYKQDEDDDDIDDDSLTEESYRTTVEEDPDDLSLDDADEISDDDY